MAELLLGERRALFTRLLGHLIARMNSAGVSPRLDEVKRPGIAVLIYGYTPEQCDRVAELLVVEFPDLAKEVTRIRGVLGSKRSVHLEGLAADIVLVSAEGKVLDKTSDHEPFGLWWELQHPLCRWGGRFNDGGHYSVTPDGVRK